MRNRFTAIVESENDSYVALCPELDIASQGGNIKKARKNLNEAIELFFESAPPLEISRRRHTNHYNRSKI